MNEEKSSKARFAFGGKPCHLCKVVKVIFLLVVGFLIGFVVGGFMK